MSFATGKTKEQAIKAWNRRPSPWHTGTPTEEGWYLCRTKVSDLSVHHFDGKEYDFCPVDFIKAWQKIEPYKGENYMTTKEMISVMQAFEEGKQIQARLLGKDNWWNCKNPSWAWSTYEYRIKPEEKPICMTNRQLSEWLARGFGECREFGVVRTHSVYAPLEENEFVSEDYLIRPWGSDKWVFPTVDIYERDCKGN